MRQTALTRLARGALLDGAMGTELIARGLDVETDQADLWNAVRGEDVVAVHQAYVTAGAQALTTNTFGANRLRLAGRGLPERVRALNVQGAVLARQARSTQVVLGSMGPSGEQPGEGGHFDLVALEEAFAEQAHALAEGGVDALVIETAQHPKELRAAIRGARAGAPELGLATLAACRRTAGGYVTFLGFPLEQLASVAVEEDVDAVGVNCALGPAELLDAVRLLVARCARPVWARPCANPQGGAPLGPRAFAEGLRALVAAGASAVGGCCGAGPGHIAAARAAFAQAPQSLDELTI